MLVASDVTSASVDCSSSINAPHEYVDTSTIIGECQPRHRHQEFLRFLNRIDQSIDPGLDIHLVLDNYGTHKHPEVKKWLAQRSRYHVHFTPPSSSWLNQVERWFAEITRKRIRRGTFRSVRDLIKAIRDYIRHYNNNPRPFHWVASVGRIMEGQEI